MKTKNKIKSLLFRLGISSPDSVIPYFPRVRDRNDVAVLRCKRSGVIFLSRSDHIDIAHYRKTENFQYWGAKDRKTALLPTAEDNKKRFKQFKNLIAGKKWIDVGTGAGGILDLLSPLAAKTVAVEPQLEARKSLLALGYKVYPLIEDVKEKNFEVVTLFHVLEHLTDPVETLKTIKNKMAKGGKIIIEVPHAKDFLLSFLNNKAFKEFTFWSEHLILHTKESLRIFLSAAGFSKIVIEGWQRYPLTNHLYWLIKGKPGGHVIWRHLNIPLLEEAYADRLKKIDKTDTLIAIAKNL